MSWDELVAVALIGTDRRSVEGGAPGDLDAVLAGRGPEDRLLASAAAWTVARRAGARAGAPRTVEPAEADPRPLCSAAAGGRLELLLEVRELVDQWLALAEDAGVRPPPELVPALLDYAEGRPERQGAVRAAAGPLGRWLAAREPRWAYVLPVDEARFSDAEDRVDLLRRRRAEDPDAAREMLASTWAEETWEDRQAFLEELETGLSDADEPLLELALGDRRKPVRDVAAALLARLPRSAFAARAAAEALALLRVEDGEIVVTLPEARGRRSERLSDLLAAAPLSTWDLEMVSLPVADDLGHAVHAGWAEAALRQNDVEWGRALGLLELLPHDEAEARAVAAEDPLSAGEPLEWTWGRALSEAVVTSVKRHREGGARGDYSFVGYRIDPTLDVEPLRELGGRDIGRLCDVAAIRAAMLGVRMTELLRPHAEQLFAEELQALERADDRPRPPQWRLSPWAVTTYVLGGEADGVTITPKYVGRRRLVELAVATLATDRALLLLGVPGTAKTWLSEHLAAAISGDSTLIVQGTAGTPEESLRYGWNYARLLAEGPTREALVPGPVFRAMGDGKIARVEELTRIPSDVQDALITILSEKALPIPELDDEVQAVQGFNVIATANDRDRGVNELSSAMRRRFNTVVLPLPDTADEEVEIVRLRLDSIGATLELPPVTSALEEIRRVVTIFRELRSGVTEDGRTKLKSPSGTLSTAEAISVVTNGMALATHFGDGSLTPEDVAGGLTGAVVQDPVADKVVWQEYLEAVVRERDGWGALYRACRAL